MLPIRVYVIWEKYKKCRRPPEVWGRLVGWGGGPAKRTQGSKKKKDKTTTNRKKKPAKDVYAQLWPYLSSADCLPYSREPGVPSKLMRTLGLIDKEALCPFWKTTWPPPTFCLPSARPPTPVWPTPPPPVRPPQRQNKTSGAPINGSVYQIVYYTLFNAVTPSLAMRRLYHFPMPGLLRFNLTLVKRSRWLRALMLLFLFI